MLSIEFLKQEGFGQTVQGKLGAEFGGPSGQLQKQHQQKLEQNVRIAITDLSIEFIKQEGVGQTVQGKFSPEMYHRQKNTKLNIQNANIAVPNNFSIPVLIFQRTVSSLCTNIGEMM